MVGVALEGERRSGVSGEGLEIPYGFPAARQQAQATMPQVVEADGGEACPLEERLIGAVHDVLGVEGSPVTGGKHEAPVPIQGPAASFSSSWRLRWLLRALTAR